MSVESAIPTVGADHPSGDAHGPARNARGRQGSAWAAVERFLVYAGDRLNPILVKETRQALKSFQFTATFVLVLIVAGS